MTNLARPPGIEPPFRIDGSCRWVPPADAAEIASAVANLLRQPLADDPPPEWLLRHQIEPFRQSVAAIRRYCGALLALPVGSGKTYVALAVAQAFPDPVVVVAPAILRHQWLDVAGRLDLPIGFVSLERISRGHRLDEPGFVILDESHRFRESRTRRYRTLAQDLVGRRALLVTATPLVNRPADLTNQLLLAVRDDALRFHGIPSLERAVPSGPVGPALAHLVVTGVEELGGVPEKRGQSIADWAERCTHLGPVLRAIDRLRLSRDRGVAALIRTSLYRALASSPAALLGSLRRYRRLLGHAADARRAGHPPSRDPIRAVVGADPEQLVWWELLAAASGPADLTLGDLPALARLERRVARWLAGPDRKLSRLVEVVSDGLPALIFCSAVETVDYLRRRIGGPGIGWLTGDRAGIGPLQASRTAVLRCFEPVGLESRQPRGPRLLIASDVAAEGLNLQRIARVIHYDLPWTAVRLEQRDGRAVRIGSEHPAVEIVRFELPPSIEARLEIGAALERKAGLPARIGLAGETREQLARDARLARRFAGRGRPGWTGAGTAAGAVAGLILRAGSGLEVGLVLAREAGGNWTGDRAVIGRVLESVGPGHGRTVSRGDRAAVLDSLAGPVARHLAATLGSRYGAGPIPARPLAFVRETLAAARRRRDASGLARAEAVLRFLARGHTAGEAMIALRVGQGDRDAVALAEQLGHPTPADDGVTATLVALAF
jgi:hypothetical protein